MRTKSFLALSLVTLLSLSAAASPAAELDLAQEFEQQATRAAVEAGIDPELILDHVTEVKTWAPDGVHVTRMRLRDAVATMFPGSVRVAGEGPLGTPEIVAGNTTHLYVDIAFGSTSSLTCGRVTVTDSATVPHAPFVPVTGAPLYATPVPGTLSPVIPTSSWLLPAYVAGGPVRHIEGSYQLGIHTVGTLIGSSASTAGGAPSPSPVWLPMVHQTSFITDNSIDFLGHATFSQVVVQFDLFGFRLCAEAGVIALSDGAAIFDNAPIEGQTVEFPDVP